MLPPRFVMMHTIATMLAPIILVAIHALQPSETVPITDQGDEAIADSNDAVAKELVKRALSGHSEALLGFEVLEIDVLHHPGGRMRVARCRVVDHLFGHVDDDQVFFALLKKGQDLILVEEGTTLVDRYVAPLESVRSPWRLARKRLEAYAKEIPILELTREPLHFVNGKLRMDRESEPTPPGSAEAKPPTYEEVLDSARELLAKRLPQVAISHYSSGSSNWWALVEPEGRVTLSTTGGLGRESDHWVLPSESYERIVAAMKELPAPPQRISLGSSERPGDTCVKLTARTTKGVVTFSVYLNADSAPRSRLTDSLAVIAEASGLLARELWGLGPFRAFGEDS